MDRVGTDVRSPCLGMGQLPAGFAASAASTPCHGWGDVRAGAWILGAGAGLAAPGVSCQLARAVAGMCEAIHLYAALRRLVFRDTRRWPG